MSSMWSSSGADSSSIWNSNSPNLNILRRYSLRSSPTLSANTSSLSSATNATSMSQHNNSAGQMVSANSGIMSSTPIPGQHNHHHSHQEQLRSAVGSSNLSAEHSLSLLLGQNLIPIVDLQQGKSSSIWEPSADNKYLIGYIIISQQDLDLYNRNLGFQLCGGKQISDNQFGAIVEHVMPASLMNLVGKLKVGDEIVEWNGFNLRNKRKSEVDDIVEPSSYIDSLRIVAVRLK